MRMSASPSGAMNFFDRQALARRNTHRMIVLFALAVLVTVMATDAVVVGAYGFAIRNRSHPGQTISARSYVAPIAVVSAAVMAMVGFGALYKIASLHSGGRAVAELLGATPLPPNSPDPAHRRLLNVVEEM